MRLYKVYENAGYPTMKVMLFKTQILKLSVSVSKSMNNIKYFNNFMIYALFIIFMCAE